MRKNNRKILLLVVILAAGVFAYPSFKAWVNDPATQAKGETFTARAIDAVMKSAFVTDVRQTYANVEKKFLTSVSAAEAEAKAQAADGLR